MGEGRVEAIEGALAARRADGPQRAGRTQGPGVDAGVEHRDVGAGRRDAIPMCARYAFDEAMQPEPAEVVGHRARRIGVGIPSAEVRDVIAQLPMAEAGGREGEETEGVHERVDAAVAEAEARGSLLVDDDGRRHGVQAVFPDQAVVAQRFDAQEAPVGGKADLPQGGQIAERTTNGKVVSIVDGGFGAKGLAFCVVLLDLGFLYCTWSDGTTPSVSTRVRKLPGVRRVTRRVKISCI